jgi:hypothetical protein
MASDILDKLVYDKRIDSVTRQLPADFRRAGIVQAGINLAGRFHKNTMKLIGR